MSRTFLFLHLAVVLGVQKSFEKQTFTVKQKVSVLSLGDQVYEPEYAIISPQKSLFLYVIQSFFLRNLVMLLYKFSHLRTEKKKKSLLFALQALHFRLKCALSKKLQMGS